MDSHDKGEEKKIFTPYSDYFLIHGIRIAHAINFRVIITTNPIVEGKRVFGMTDCF